MESSDVHTDTGESVFFLVPLLLLLLLYAVSQIRGLSTYAYYERLELRACACTCEFMRAMMRNTCDASNIHTHAHKTTPGRSVFTRSSVAYCGKSLSSFSHTLHLFMSLTLWINIYSIHNLLAITTNGASEHTSSQLQKRQWHFVCMRAFSILNLLLVHKRSPHPSASSTAD